LAAVAFETDYEAPDSSTFLVKENTLKGNNAPSSGEYALSVGYRNYTEPVFTSALDESLQRNCLGESGTNALILSEFVLFVDPTNSSKRELRCSGNGQVQPIIDNVANFQVRYLLQDNTTTPGTSTIKSVDASGVGANWSKVQAVEVCLVLYGSESIDMPTTGSVYTDCDGTSVNMTTLATPRNRRMHIAFRNVFQLRSQGLVGSVL
jgi:type IV pilus assembly protein PilW